jgi:glycosyltransferase involved in cell wall biosynthesis
MNSPLPTISVVTCSYQQGAFLDATIRSLVDQHYPGLEYILIDGGSTDETLDVIGRHAEQIDYWASEPDEGQTDALIKGFAHSSGDIMGWLCSDDLLLPHALETVGQFFADHPETDAVYGDALWIDRSGDFIRPKKEIGFSRFMLRFDHNYVPQPAMFWRRRLFEKAGGLNRSFQLAMDTDLWDRFSEHSRIVHIPQYLACMRFYPEQKTRAQRANSLKEDSEIRRRSAWSAPPFGAVLRRVARIQRCALKFLKGGYFSTVPSHVVQQLQPYRIEER